MRHRLMTISILAVLVAAAAFGDTNKKTQVERGGYLVRIMGCNDCHTPWKMGPKGPEPDMSRALSGHPESIPITAGAKLPDSIWIAAASATNTAWSGPWGVSFTANLTPDKETGLGNWTEDQFVQTLRTGRHLGIGRPILPPMPWTMIGSATDEDLKAIFGYLQSLPPVKNKVPQPLEPDAPKAE
ncbi:MAG TPA: diheme cytochrome c-553 [Thermoanaerobaculia bacterium]|nr:diheme cytochrome c-553 [Thermoanaerobaculia bacterium]